MIKFNNIKIIVEGEHSLVRPKTINEKIYNDFKEKGINFRKELIKEDWGTNFSFLDPDDNKLQFVFK